MKYFFALLLCLPASIILGQTTETSDTVRLLFIGDVMGHDSQIAAAYDSSAKRYNFDPVFEPVAPLIQSYDWAIANLEVTLAGKPYKGYPQFSSPDALAKSLKKAGIDVLATANNHSCDRGKRGVQRTIRQLDSLQLLHTGTFLNQAHRDTTNLVLLDRNSIRLGMLNYTYGTNGIRLSKPAIVNLMDTSQMAQDILHARKQTLDKLIVFIHWGKEYQQIPNKRQKQMARFLFKKGVDIIIGSHPHVLQPMEYHPAKDGQSERFVAYSLGNFVSNQRTQPREGGAMVALELTKQNGKTRISDKGYHFSWVHKPNPTTFRILPASLYEQDTITLEPFSRKKMSNFLKTQRKLLKNENKQVDELRLNKNL
ncbi:MAG: CapA family protein [Cytophagales bacterium]|nr:CapA family protein [Cytophagales bacterium]